MSLTSPAIRNGRELVYTVTANMLGFAPEQVWNPSPSHQHRTTPYPVPKRLEMGLRGTPESGAKYSPPPFAVVVEQGDRRTLVAVGSEPGWHRWNQAVFDTAAGGVTVTLDLEGMTDPALAAPHIAVRLFPGRPDESRHALLARGLAALYPDSAAVRPAIPDWWQRPIYCGWGDQVTAAMWLEGQGEESRALAYCIQGLYERWIARLDEAAVPFGTIIIDAGWSPAGWWEPSTILWPDLKGFIARQHARGRRVLLWLGTWLYDGLPAAWCVHRDGNPICADPTNPDYRDYVTRQVTRLIGADGFDADGFKIDQLAYAPTVYDSMFGPRFGAIHPRKASGDRPRLHGDGFGCELLHALQHTIYTSAKSAKPDALVTSSTVHPYFRDTFDMVRIHDMGQVAPDIFDAMRARVELAQAALPGIPIDTDDWIHTDYDMWMRYTSGSRILGVPCIFYAERFMRDWKGEPATTLIPMDDLRRIAAAWRKADGG